MTAKRCAVCGREIERVRPCWVHKRYDEAICDECCEECYRSEPFPCPDHDTRFHPDKEG